VETTSPGLYAIADVCALERRGLDVERAALAIVAGGPQYLQLRAKKAGAAETLSYLKLLRAPTRRAGVRLFANDRADLAQAAECDGVHVGQDDLPLEDVRRCFPGLQVGVSTHDEAQFARALEARADYVALGPIFATSSKENPDPVVGLERLRSLCALAEKARVPVVAIGGIDVKSTPDVTRAGASIALISALLPSAELSGDAAYADITSRTTKLAALMAAR
jgi:thiamine-phosphate pyrophosphorylase